MKRVLKPRHILKNFSATKQWQPQFFAFVSVPALATALLLTHSVNAFSQAHELSLSDALKLALDNSRDIKEEKASLAASDSEVSRVNADFFPTLNLVGDTGTYHDRAPLPGDVQIPIVPRDHNTYDLRLELKEVLFSGFSTSASSQSAKASQKIEAHKLESAQQSTRTDLTLTYFKIQTVRRKIVTHQQMLALDKSQLNQVLNRRNAGRATDLDELNARVNLQSEEPQIRTLSATLENLSLHLNRILGVPITDQHILTDDLEKTAKGLDAAQKMTLNDAFEKALAANPDIRRLEAESDKVSADLKLADAANLPVVDVRGYGGIGTYLQNEIGTQNSTVYGALFEVSVPIFSGFSTLYLAQEKRARLESVTESRSKARENLLELLQQTFRQIDVNRENIKAGETNVQLSKQGTTRADSLFSAGRATLPDVQRAYALRLTAEEKLADDYLGSIQTITQLKNLIGQ